MKSNQRSTLYNATSILGLTIASTTLLLIIVLILVDMFAGLGGAYTGLVTYIALPAVMFFGLFVALIGWVRERRRRKRGEATPDLPVIDLNTPRHRRIFTTVGLGGLFLMALSGFGSFQAYEYTESVQFCGTTCHTVMEPEFVAYQASPHARVTCTGCHIGEGVDWYVKSKLSGAYQVYSTLFDKFERPIKTPIANLRPAKETCEQCHWPKHFFTQKMRTHTYYLSDEENTAHEMTMLVKVGGGEGSASTGIHAHMYLDAEISYIATDRRRQVIPYVEARGKDGKVTVYRDKSLEKGAIPKGEKRIVDCIECHNRPTHIFKAPDDALNEALTQGEIARSLPGIRSAAFDALEAKYTTKPAALKGIEKTILDHFRESYPDVAKSRAREIAQAIKVTQAIYTQNYFPEMKTDWKSHHDNLDHMHDLGCFRCHDDQHVSDDGKVISRDCKTCHTFVAQGPPGPNLKQNIEGQEFLHPVDIGDDWKTTNCVECHGVEPEE